MGRICGHAEGFILLMAWVQWGNYPRTASRRLFTDEMETPYVNVMTTFADGLYTVVAKYQDYRAQVSLANV